MKGINKKVFLMIPTLVIAIILIIESKLDNWVMLVAMLLLVGVLRLFIGCKGELVYFGTDGGLDDEYDEEMFKEYRGMFVEATFVILALSTMFFMGCLDEVFQSILSNM